MSLLRTLVCCVVLMLFGLFQERAEAQFPVHLKKFEIPSTLDQTLQPSMFWAPHVDTPRPILVFLHSWSGDYRQDNIRWLKEAVERKWIFLHPNFRGRNNHPEACGSELARQDILDAIDWVMKNVPVDRERVYLAGSSGGGHMAMLMAGHAPDRFSAVSAWVGISDLRRWYEFHTRTGAPDNYGKMILNSLSGSPGESPEIDFQYQDRSPICHLHQVGNLPLDLCAGLHDGHTGSVPIDHSLLAFNVIASANHFPLISEMEINELLSNQPLSNPQTHDLQEDPDFSRKIYLRREAGPARVTIFEGGHESLPEPSCAWLEKQSRPANWEILELPPPLLRDQAE